MSEQEDLELEKIAREDFEEAERVLKTFVSEEKNMNNLIRAARAMADCIKAGGKIISCGNGGSHCDAMHFAEELTGRYREDRPAYPAIAISDPSHISCVSNDYGYEYVFSRYVEALGREGDCLLAITTSGHSKNVLEAVKTAKEKGMTTILLTGKSGGVTLPIVDIGMCVHHWGYADRTQEVHIKIIHILIRLIEIQLAKKDTESL
jgi:D-sedoheptulose 7-phosphate isomerase